MWHIAIPAICVLAHLYLVVLFLPALWREIDQQGLRWHTAFGLFVVPLAVVALMASHVLGNLGSLPIWLVVVSFLAIDALVLAMVLAAVGLRSRRGRSA